MLVHNINLWHSKTV